MYKYLITFCLCVALVSCRRYWECTDGSDHLTCIKGADTLNIEPSHAAHDSTFQYYQSKGYTIIEYPNTAYMRIDNSAEVKALEQNGAKCITKKELEF